jgi:transmembrane sensor
MQKNSSIPVDIELLIVDYLRGVITKEGNSRLDEWLSMDNENIIRFNLFKTSWIASGKPVSISNENIDAALAGVKSALEMKEEKIVRKPFWTFYKIAASWIIFLIIGGSLNYYFHRGVTYNASKTVTMVTAPLGSRSLVDLPDGTKVWLNAGSRLTYSNEYDIQSREVNLSGEAYFSVKSNKAKPFLVKTTEVTVKALGTKFNVKAYPEEDVITATLEEGIIEVTSNQNRLSHDKVTLKPNEMITYVRKLTKPGLKKDPAIRNIDKKEMKVISNVNTEPVTSWKDQTWIIDAQPLGILAPIFERRYNIQISFSSDEISRFKFTGKIEDETIEQIMSALELSAPIHYEMEKNHLLLTIDKNRINRYRQNTNPD